MSASRLIWFVLNQIIIRSHMLTGVSEPCLLIWKFQTSIISLPTFRFEPSSNHISSYLRLSQSTRSRITRIFWRLVRVSGHLLDFSLNSSHPTVCSAEKIGRSPNAHRKDQQSQNFPGICDPDRIVIYLPPRKSDQDSNPESKISSQE